MAYGSALTAYEDPGSARKARGAFFTPPELADYLCSFAITQRGDRILEPSCGEAAFLTSAARRMTSLGMSANEIGRSILGCELHRASAESARRRLRSHGFSVEIIVGDFFDVTPSEERFSAVIGNPPYIRYQEFPGAQRAKARESALSMGVRLDALASSWAHFVIHGARFLASGGRMALVLPAELLTANYAAPVRRFFLERFSAVEVTLFERPVFPEVQEEVILLCADGFDHGPCDCISLTQVNSVSELGTSAALSIGVGGDQRWPVGKAAYDAQNILAALGSSLVPLSSYGDIRLGAVTGSNKFFALKNDEVRGLGLEESDLVPICPPGSHHLRSLSFTEDDFRNLTAGGKRTMLFSPSSQPSMAGWDYIAKGETTGVDRAYKCRVRSPWWRVPGLKPCDLFFTYMNGSGPNLCENSARICYLNSVHGLFLRADTPPDARRLLPIAALSSCSLLSAELVGRSYGGGILKLEPKEAAQMLVPSPETLERLSGRLLSARDAVDRRLGKGERDDATLAVDEILLPSLGISSQSAQRMHGLLLELRARRSRRSNPNRKTRG